MNREVQRADMSESVLLVATNSHLELESDFIEKSIDISELSTELGIQLDQIKVQSDEMERVKLDHITVLGKFKECDGEFNKLDVFVSKL